MRHFELNNAASVTGDRPLLASGSSECRADSFLEAFIRTRSEQTFSDLATVLFPRLYRYFLRCRCNPEVAEELAQDVLFALYRHAQSVRDPGHSRAWLFTVAKNCLRERWRRARREVPTVSFDSADCKVLLVSRTASCRSSRDLAGCLRLLSPSERTILKLRYVDGLEYKDLADRFSIPLGTAKWKVFNAVAKMSKQAGLTRER